MLELLAPAAPWSRSPPRSRTARTPSIWAMAISTRAATRKSFTHEGGRGGGLPIAIFGGEGVSDTEHPAHRPGAARGGPGGGGDQRDGVDAVIVQDLGVARMLRQVAPDLHLHGSTQMTVHPWTE